MLAVFQLLTAARTFNVFHFPPSRRVWARVDRLSRLSGYLTILLTLPVAYHWTVREIETPPRGHCRRGRGDASRWASFLLDSLPELVRTGTEAAELRDETMTGKAIQDLVGRVMIDSEFLAELVRDPDVILAGYELSAEERAVIKQALGHGIYVSEEERAHVLQNVMLKRWAT